MFISTAVMLTREIEARLLQLQDSGAFGDSKTDFIRSLLRTHMSDPASTAANIAREANLSVRTVHELTQPQGAATVSGKYASAFLSYGGPDEEFARKLYERLVAEGVETFFFPECAAPGQRLHRTMSDGIHEFDRILLICSRASLERRGVLNELEQVLAREAREGGTELLLPVLLDDYALGEWAPVRVDLARQVKERVAADFRNASEASQFAKQVSRVLYALAIAP